MKLTKKLKNLASILAIATILVGFSPLDAMNKKIMSKKDEISTVSKVYSLFKLSPLNTCLSMAKKHWKWIVGAGCLIAIYSYYKEQARLKVLNLDYQYEIPKCLDIKDKKITYSDICNYINTNGSDLKDLKNRYKNLYSWSEQRQIQGVFKIINNNLLPNNQTREKLIMFFAKTTDELKKEIYEKMPHIDMLPRDVRVYIIYMINIRLSTYGPWCTREAHKKGQIYGVIYNTAGSLFSEKFLNNVSIKCGPGSH